METMCMSHEKNTAPKLSLLLIGSLGCVHVTLFFLKGKDIAYGYQLSP